MACRLIAIRNGRRVARRLPAFGVGFHRESINAAACRSGSRPAPQGVAQGVLRGLLPCFFPDWADRFDFGEIDWLDKELFLAPPRGERRQLDLVARLKLKPGAPPPRDGVNDLVALIHVEVESRESTVPFRPRMFDYYVQLRRDTGLPVLPIAVFLRVGMNGIGWDAYEEHFWEEGVIRFRYANIGLPGVAGSRTRPARTCWAWRRAPDGSPRRPSGRAVRGGIETDRRFGRE